MYCYAVEKNIFNRDLEIMEIYGFTYLYNSLLYQSIRLSVRHELEVGS